jgi:predicted transcriptional regulator of viral defense system
VTSAQARGQGVSVQQLKTLADRAVLHRLQHGVYAAAGAPASPLDQLRATWLALEPTRLAHERLEDPLPVVVSHRTAALIHDLGDLDADRVEFTTPTRRTTRDPDVRFHRATLQPADWTIIDGLPITTIPTTIRDLARIGIDGGHLAGAIRAAILTHGVDPERIVTALAPYSHHYGAPLGDGRTLLRQVLAQAWT